jgi:hypothetical protein
MEIRKILFLSSILLLLSTKVYGAWSGPQTIISGIWGNSVGEFGIRHGDTTDQFAGPFYILSDGTIIVQDSVNGRFVRYSSSGTIITTTVCVQDAKGNWNGDCRIEGDYEVGINSNGFWSKSYDNNNYYFQDNTGTLLTTTSSRPMELGILSQKITGTSHYKRIEYPDGVYFYYYTGSTGYFKYESELFRVNSNLILDNQGSTVYAFTATAISTPAGQKQQYQLLLNATWKAPQNQYKVIRPADNNFGLEEKDSIIAEYGEAVIGPDGSIYTWVRSDTDYKIVKWTWSP